MGQPSNEAKKAWLERNKHKRPEINRSCRLRLFYGLYKEQYEDLLKQQDNKCAICRKEFGDEKSSIPHIDHEHSTRWVRGLLCTNCNSGIGMFKDNVDSLNNAIDYLISNSTPPEFIFIPLKLERKSRKGKPSDWLVGNKHAEGHKPWNKGKTFSEESKKKMSDSAKKRWSKV